MCLLVLRGDVGSSLVLNVGSTPLAVILIGCSNIRCASITALAQDPLGSGLREILLLNRMQGLSLVLWVL